MQAVTGLGEDEAPRALENVGSNFFAAVGWQAM
jgi:hypothetical protein